MMELGKLFSQGLKTIPTWEGEPSREGYGSRGPCVVAKRTLCSAPGQITVEPEKKCCVEDRPQAVSQFSTLLCNLTKPGRFTHSKTKHSRK